MSQKRFGEWLRKTAPACVPVDVLRAACPSSKDVSSMFRGSCSDISCQLPRYIVPVALIYRVSCHRLPSNVSLMASKPFLWRFPVSRGPLKNTGDKKGRLRLGVSPIMVVISRRSGYLIITFFVFPSLKRMMFKPRCGALIRCPAAL